MIDAARKPEQHDLGADTTRVGPHMLEGDVLQGFAWHAMALEQQQHVQISAAESSVLGQSEQQSGRQNATSGPRNLPPPRLGMHSSSLHTGLVLRTITDSRTE